MRPSGTPAGSNSYSCGGGSLYGCTAACPCTARSQRSSTAARSAVPQTISISPVTRTRAGSVCAKQPQAAITARGLSRRSRWNARIFLWSDTDVTVQVLTTTASASFVTTSCPRARANCSSACVSKRLTLQPKVKNANFINTPNNLLCFRPILPQRNEFSNPSQFIFDKPNQPWYTVTIM